ncbi:MAG: MlrC C-terminal domain-containing protein, partial [Planctomycetaceae bacterium]
FTGRCRPTMALAKVPVLTAAIHGGTEGPGPFRDVVRYAKWHERLPGVLSTSVFLVHPYLDLPGLGSGAVVVTDNDPALARELATRMAHLYWLRRESLEPDVCTPVEALQCARHCPPGPVLLVETADCCGGGAAGDSVATLRALLTEGRGETAVVGVVDPAAATACHAAGVGAAVRFPLGHQVDPQWGTPCDFAGVVERLLGGEFTYRGGIFDGQTASMGPSAVVRSGGVRSGGVRVLISSQGTYDWQGEQWEAAGLDPREFRFLVVKNPMNFRQTYGSLATGVFVLDTPGPTPATVRHVPYRQLTGGWYPRDRDLPLRMDVCESAG